MVGRGSALLSVLLIAAGAASCAGSATPLIAEPTPTPPPAGSFCTFMWMVPEGNGAFDWYEVDVAGKSWSSGPTDLGATATAFYILGYNPPMLTFDVAGMTTAGSFVLTTTGMDTGAKTSFLDLGGKTFFDATDVLAGLSNELGSQVATGGAGTFSGFLSSPDPEAPIVNGDGSVAVHYANGTTGVFGGSAPDVTQFAYCVP